MSYSRNTWVDGDTITADKLNHIENGIYYNAEDIGDCLKTTQLRYNLFQQASVRFPIVPVSGNTVVIMDELVTNPLSFEDAMNAYASVLGCIFAIPTNQQGTAYRVFTVSGASVPDQTVNLFCIDSGVLYEVAVQDTGSGLTGTLTTKTL